MDLLQKALISSLPTGFPIERFELINVEKITNETRGDTDIYPYQLTYTFQEKNLPPAGYEDRPIISK